MYMDKGEWNEMRVLLFCQDEGWMRYVEKGFRMCRENLEPLEIDGRKTEEEFFDSLWMKQYDIIVMHGVPRMKASWGTFFQLVEQAWRETARRKKKYMWRFGRTAIALEEREIYYIQSRKKEVSAPTACASYRISTSMKAEEARLPADRFVRIHRNCFVNLEHIKSMEGKRIMLVNGACLQTSIRRHRMVAERIQAYGKAKIYKERQRKGT